MQRPALSPADGCDFGPNGVLVVTSLGGQVGAAAASSYHLNGVPAIVPVELQGPSPAAGVGPA